MFEKRVFDGKVKYIWMDGRLVPREEAMLHVETECVMRGANGSSRDYERTGTILGQTSLSFAFMITWIVSLILP